MSIHYMPLPLHSILLLRVSVRRMFACSAVIGLLGLCPMIASAQSVATTSGFVDIPSIKYPITETSIPIVEEQVRLGHLLDTDTFNITLEFLETERLSQVEVRQLRQQGFVPSEQPVLQVVKGVSRRETLADVSFVPVVCRDGKWLRITSYKLKVRNIGPRILTSMRNVAQYVETVSYTGRYASHSVLAVGKWVKIKVKEEGIYQLSNSQLRKMGFPNPSKVKLYGYGGRLLPEKFDYDTADGLIDDLCEVPLYRREGDVLFFAEGLLRYGSTGLTVNTYANDSYYFLTEGDEPLAWSETAPTATTSFEPVSTVPAYSYIYGTDFMWYGGGRDFYDKYDLQGAGHTYRLSMPGSTDDLATVYYDVSAQSSTSSVKAQFSVGGEVVAETLLPAVSEGESARGYRGAFQLMPNDAVDVKAQTSSTGRLGYLYAVYTQRLDASVTKKPFTTGMNGAVELTISNANAHTQVWQLGNAHEPVAQLQASLSGNILTAKADNGNRRFIIVDAKATYNSPEIVGSIENQDLHADANLDYIIIIPSSGKLQAQAQRLADEHAQSHGLRVKVVRANQIYNEFSSGTPDVAAYRRYLKMLYDKAATLDDAPKYLLLFGDGAYDNRMVTAEWKGSNPDDYLLAFERNDQESYQHIGYSIGTLHSYVSDDYFAYLDDNEGYNFVIEKIDLGVGRFLCHDVTLATHLVDTSLKYQRREYVGAWKNNVWLIGDSGDDNLHMNDAQAVGKQLETSKPSGIVTRRIFPDVYAVTQTSQGGVYPETRTKITQVMQQGALWLNYNGHGDPSRLSKHFILMPEDVANSKGNGCPLWVFASCEITPFDQAIDDLGRLALYNRKSPALAVICSTRSVYSNYNRALNLGVARFAFEKKADGSRYTLGDVMRETKCQLIRNTTSSIGVDQTINKMKYVLLGDPAVALAYPDNRIVVESINGAPVSSSSLTQLKAGSEVVIGGYICSESDASAVDETFNGEVSGTLFTPLQSITCKGYGCTRTSPLTFTDYTRTLFQGIVRVSGGRFNLKFLVPRSTPQSTAPGFLSLYALSNDSIPQEFCGSFSRFCYNGIENVEYSDSIGPEIYVYLNHPDFPDGGIVGPSPTFYATINDSTGVLTMSGNMGHDMELWLDGNPAEAVLLGDYFSFDYESYTKGFIEYPMEDLTPGPHYIDFRAWDVYDNSTTTRLHFTVRGSEPDAFDVYAAPLSDAPSSAIRFITSFQNDSGSPTTVRTEVYDLYGRCVWSKSVQTEGAYVAIDWPRSYYSGAPIDAGVYFYRSVVGGKETGTKKIILRR